MMAQSPRKRSRSTAIVTPRGSNGNDEPIDAPKILITSREHDFSASSWWLVDVEGDGVTQGASPLVKRCMRINGWDLKMARKVLKAYRQFLFLKKQYEDWDAKLLSPSLLVDQMWHQHIRGKPLGKFEFTYNGSRIDGRKTANSLSSLGFSKDERVLRVEAIDREEAARMAEQRKAYEYENEKMRIKVKDQNGCESSFAIRRCYKLSTIINKYASMNGIGAEHLYFVLNGEKIRCEDTALELGLKNQDELHIIHEQLSPMEVAAKAYANEPIIILIRDQANEKTLFRVRRNTMMSTVFNAYASRKGVDAGRLRFLLDGALLNSSGTALTLGIEDNELIDVVLEQRGC